MKLISFAISLQLLLLSQPIWAAPICSEIFSKSFDRTAYIEQTSQQSSVKVALQTLFTGATALQLGTPTMLRGIPMKGIFWWRDGHLLRGMKRANGDGMSPWGKMNIFTQSGEADLLSITITPFAGFRYLSGEKLRLLQEIFPSLSILLSSHPGPDNLFSEETVRAAKEIQFMLWRSQMPQGESFEASSRSLVTTLLNDPKGLLGLNPKIAITKQELPKKLRSVPFLKENLDYFANFGQWANVVDSRWSAYKIRDNETDSSLKSTVLSIDLRTEQMSFWLENAHFVNEVAANVRRVVWSLLAVGYDQSNGNLPRANISGINGVSVTGLNLDGPSLALVKVLDITQNDSRFNQPLINLNPQQKQWVSDWFIRNFDQRDLAQGQIIRLNSIVSLDE